MLLVGGFRPIQKSYSNQSLAKSNFKQSSLQPKADSVHFTSRVSQATKEADKEVAELTQEFLTKYSDVLGENFHKNFLEPVTQFLQKYGVSIKHENVGDAEIRVHSIALNGGIVHNTQGATLVNKDNHIIHNIFKIKYGMGYNEPIKGLTKNSSSVTLFNKFIKGELRMYDNINENFPNPMENAVSPENLKETTEKLGAVIASFRRYWVDTRHDDDNLKAQRLQKALKILMPEE